MAISIKTNLQANPNPARLGVPISFRVGLKSRRRQETARLRYLLNEGNTLFFAVAGERVKSFEAAADVTNEETLVTQELTLEEGRGDLLAMAEVHLEVTDADGRVRRDLVLLGIDRRIGRGGPRVGPPRPPGVM